MMPLMPSSCDPAVVELEEYATSEPVALDGEQRASLARVAEGRLTLLAGPDPGTVQLKASSYVGAIAIPGMRIRIAPKVSIGNLFALFTAGLDATDFTADLADWAGADFVEGLAAFLVRSTDIATSRGMLHGYREVEERVPAVRGRLLIDQIAARPWELAPAPCRFDDFTADTVENRILGHVVRNVLRWPHVDLATRRRARRLLERFDRVGDLSAAEALVRWPEITRLNQHLEVPLALARLVLANAGLTDAQGDQHAHGFLVDMNALYERWIAEELTLRLSPHMATTAQESTYLAKGQKVHMRPDLVFRQDDDVVLVGDTKYKISKSGIARGDDYYQLLAYTVAHQTASGLLIYCTAEPKPPKTVTIRHLDKKLVCYHVPLAGTPQELSRR
ncbi:MAG TPA: hypothetical protein VFT35_05265, partial [Gaiellaceae bacterium]|nr:hypothetical protein [Gaiellaceae bacterium]